MFLATGKSKTYLVFFISNSVLYKFTLTLHYISIYFAVFMHKNEYRRTIFYVIEHCFFLCAASLRYNWHILFSFLITENKSSTVLPCPLFRFIFTWSQERCSQEGWTKDHRVDGNYYFTSWNFCGSSNWSFIKETSLFSPASEVMCKQLGQLAAQYYWLSFQLL